MEKYCEFLNLNHTNDCSILSLKNLRLTGHSFVKYDFKEVMDKLSDQVNISQIEKYCYHWCNLLRKREIQICNDMRKCENSLLYLEYILALTDKLIFCTCVNQLLLKNSLMFYMHFLNH